MIRVRREPVGFLIVTILVYASLSPLARGSDNGSYVPKHGNAIVLFDGSAPANFDSFLESKGLNNDPEHVFKFEDGVIHVSGTEMGYLITKKDFADYYLRAEFKWGEATHAPREGMARDSGILYHVQGEQKVWPTSLEYQICEGQTGDFYMTDGAALTGTDGKRETGPPHSAARIKRIGEGPWQNVTGYRDPNGEIEKPHGEWNVVEIVVKGDNVKHYLNGKLVNEGTKAYPASGKILIQSEGAEVYFRDIKLYPLKP
jgi:3-keto-disaccharide hydrolase